VALVILPADSPEYAKLKGERSQVLWRAVEPRMLMVMHMTAPVAFALFHKVFMNTCMSVCAVMLCDSPEYAQLKEERSRVLWRAVERIIPDIRSRAEVSLQ
jgi:hypothetical protein